MAKAKVHSRILITGATSAIGSELASLYAQPNVTLYLHGRNTEKLTQVAQRCYEAGAEVFTQHLDLRDFSSLQQWLQTLDRLDLVVINAGMNAHIGPSGEPEPMSEVEALLDVNLKATMVIVQAVLPAMRKQGKGQIALISSLAAYFGLPVTPTYSATKAAIKAYGESLRGWLASEGVRVNVVMPGYVKSAMCDDMPGPKPFLWTPQRAAKSIKLGLDRNRARISFPFPLNWGAWWLTVLPAAISQRIVCWLGYHKHHD